MTIQLVALLKAGFQATKLTGDASLRSFYRLKKKKSSFILLVDPQWHFSCNYPSIQRFLSKKNLWVPKFYEANQKEGFILMEDLGDLSLENSLKKKNRLAQLKKSVFLLATLHGETFPVPHSLSVSKRFFDAKKYKEELKFTLEHVPRFLKSKKIVFHKELENFCKELEKITPYVFCHRDFHSRNLMMFKNRPYMIDFQDARMGPVHYDLSSLLFDSYILVKKKERTLLLNYYKHCLKSYPLFKKINWDTFEYDFYRVSYQRVLKASGSFASFYNRFHKKTHLKYLKPALTYAVQINQLCGNSLPLASVLEDWIKKCPK